MVINHHAFPSVALQQNASQGFSSTSMLPTADFEKTPYQVDFESVWKTQDVTGKPDFLLLKRKQANLVTQGKAATEKLRKVQSGEQTVDGDQLSICSMEE